MEIKQIDKLSFKDDCIKDYIKLLLNKEFKIFVYEEKNICWFMFSKNENIGNCEYRNFIGFSFSTKHKANRETGTGYQTETEISNPTELNAVGTFIKYPCWENSTKNINSIIKYKNLDEYFNKENVLTFTEVLK